MNKKVIIWGHKLGSHTHSYVHNGYYRASQYLGYDTYWFSDDDNVESFDFSNSIFITEHNVRARMPIRDDCIYFDHFCDDVFKLTPSRPVHPNYYNFAFFADGWNWPDSGELEEFGAKHFLHKSTNTITTIWATDLLPNEIDSLEPKLHDESLELIYFIGTPQGTNIQRFEAVCNANNKHFQKVGGWLGIDQRTSPSIEQNVQYVRDSYVSVDIREAVHLDQGRYYPCRLFKNISYGRWTGSNQPELSDVFGDHYTADSNVESLYYKLVEDSRNCTYEKLKDAMNLMRDHHTYVSRIKSMFSILN